jgi:hypothetical protein
MHILFSYYSRNNISTINIMSNLEMVESIGRIVKAYANTLPFYIRDLSMCTFWYPQGVLEVMQVNFTESASSVTPCAHHEFRYA